MQSLAKTLIQGIQRTESMLHRMFVPPVAPSLQFSFDGYAPAQEESEQWGQEGTQKETVGASPKPFGDLFEQSVWNMAVPKSKVSPGKKRMAWKQHIPAAIDWTRCAKCGEPKRPHRICTKNIEVCAMRPEEYQEYLSSNLGAAPKAPE